jgi:hypothetical protein
VPEYVNIGVARISPGSAMARVTRASIINSAKEIFKQGGFSSFLKGVSGGVVENLFDSV